MQFRNVVGQKAAKQGLLRMWKQDHFPHALLLAGAEGTGGLPMAVALAQFIFCTDKQPEDSCGVCNNCRRVAKFEHPDLHLSFPAIKPKPTEDALSRFYIKEFREFFTQTPYGTAFDWLQFIDAENKQGNIPAEECREMINTLNLKSYEGDKKIQIIWRAEYLGKEGNILLKLIEEPPPDTVLILVVENMENMLTTIISRTQIIKLPPLSASDISEALVTRANTDEKKALQIGHIADGSYTEALQLLRQTEHDLFPAVRNWFNALFTNNGAAISKFAEEWAKAGREQQKNFLHYVIQLLEQTIRSRYLPEVHPALPQEETAFVRKLASMNIPFEAFETMVKEITNAIFYISRNAHAKTQLHALSIRLVYAIKGKVVPVM